MASLAVLPLTQLSLFPSKPINRSTGFPTWPCKQRSSNSTRLNRQKIVHPQYVFLPLRFSEGFGEASLETKASKNLHNFFNYIAVKIVSAQLQSYNPEAYNELMEFLNTHSLNDGDKFCASLMRESSRHKSLALGILEVRSAYCKHDFEWDNLKRLAFKMVDESNTKLMGEYVLETSHETEKETGK